MTPLVGIIMGSRSDLEVMSAARDTLAELDVPYELKVVSAHRTPGLMAEYASSAEQRGIRIIIAGAGGSAHLPGMVAALTTLPVFGVPIPSTVLNGLDSLLATIQMPAGNPVAKVTLGSAGPINAALVAVQILALSDAGLRQKLHAYKEKLRRKVAEGDAKVQAEVAKLG